MKRSALKYVLDTTVLKINDGHTEAAFVRISLDEYPALGRGLEQRFIDRFQLLLLPQQAIIARLPVGRDHSFVQSEYGFISFCPLLQDLSEKIWSACHPASNKAGSYINTIGNNAPRY